MRQVYAPANVAEAHMLVHMLGEHDILAHIHGEALLGGVGELPAGGLLQVMVAEEDFDAARRLILAWEKTDTPSPTPKPALPFIAGLIVFALGLLGGWIVHAIGGRNAIPIDSGISEQDLNGDGEVDQTYFFRVGGGGYAYKVEVDRNFDGEVDLIQYFDNEGVSTTSYDADDNFDGAFETKAIFRNGNILRADIDSNRDGIVDLRAFYRDGILSREEILNPADQRLIRVNFYNNLLLARAEVDLDRDGFLETVRTIDATGEITSTETRTRS